MSNEPNFNGVDEQQATTNDWSESSMSDANIYSHQVDQLHSMSNETMLNEREPFQDPRINFAEVDRHIVVVPTSLESNHDYLYKDLPQINTDIATGVETNPNTFEFKNEPKKGPLQSIKSLLQAARNKKKGNRKRETRDSRNCCCRKRVLIPLIVLALIIITLAVLAYLIFPSAPSVEVTDPVPEPSGFLVNGQPISAIGGTIAQQPTIELSIAMGTQVTYSSSSYITLGLRKVEVSAGIKDANGQIIPDFNGFGQVNDLRLPARETTIFDFPFKLLYTAKTNASPLTSPGIQVLATSCLVSPPRPLIIRMTITVDISAISWTGWRPSYSFDRKQDCPNIEQLGQLVSILSGIS